MPEMISLLLVDDQQLLREGMRLLLELEEDLTVVGEAGNGLEAIDLYTKLRPDVVLMDVQMSEMNGIDATQHIFMQDPQAKIIILTTFDDDEYVFEGIRAGALGYILKAMSGDELARAVRTAHRGDAWLEVSVARKVIDNFTRMPPSSDPPVVRLFTPLNEREMDVLHLLIQGCRNREIAVCLHLAEGTVKNYVSSLMRKLNVQDRAQAVLQAKKLGLV